MFRTWHGGVRIVIRSEMKWILNLTASRECLANEEQSSNEIVSINRSLNSVWRSSSAKNRNRFTQVPTSMNLYNFRNELKVDWLDSKEALVWWGEKREMSSWKLRDFFVNWRGFEPIEIDFFFARIFSYFDKIDDLTWGLHLNSFRWDSHHGSW